MTQHSNNGGAATSPLRPDREMAIKAMQAMGWTAQRIGSGKKVAWRFTRPDTGGLWDRVDCKQANLSMRWVTDVAMRYDDAPELVCEVAKAKERWIKQRFHWIYTRADAPAQEASHDDN